MGKLSFFFSQGLFFRSSDHNYSKKVDIFSCMYPIPPRFVALSKSIPVNKLFIVVKMCNLSRSPARRQRWKERASANAGNEGYYQGRPLQIPTAVSAFRISYPPRQNSNVYTLIQFLPFIKAKRYTHSNTCMGSIRENYFRIRTPFLFMFFCSNYQKWL